MIHLGRFVYILSEVGAAGSAAPTDGSSSGGGGVVVDSWEYALITWAITQAFILVNVTRDANSAIVTADIQWPDGVNGTLIIDKVSDFPGVVDAWRATYASDPMKTVTQSAVTRDANGAVISQPVITVS